MNNAQEEYLLLIVRYIRAQPKDDMAIVAITKVHDLRGDHSGLNEL